ncbi:MAG: diguanylate cyclase [Sphingomonadales bacterium]|nr:diguanylate cyclase [Sphingomonadales bacterium]MDE2169532.1 diguanylate cyclase [Sphingomonadales bacterium]
MTGVAFAAMGMIALQTSPMASGLAFLWPSTALLVVRLHTRRLRDWPLMVAACMLALGVMLALHGVQGRCIALMTTVDTIETLGASWMMRALMKQGDQPVPSEEIGWLLRAIFAVSLLPAFACGLLLWAMLGLTPHGWETGRDWFLGHALGMMILLPCFSRMQRLRHNLHDLMATFERRWSWRDVATLGFTALMAASAIVAFALSTRPLLFLPVLVLVAAMLWVELFTLSWMYLILATISAVMTIKGFSPLAQMHVSMAQQLASAQVYLLFTVACVTPVSGLVRKLQRSLRELRESEARYRLLADHSTDIIVSSGLEGRAHFCSPSISKLCQRDPDAMIGRRLLTLVDPQYRRRVAEAYLRALARPGTTVEVEFAGLRCNGQARWFEAHLRGVADQRGVAECVVSVIRDMSERKQVESALTQAAFTDPLTGLANRRALMEAMVGCIDNRQAGCLAVIDLDHFKLVNDRFGHAAGDAVLRSFARVARQGLRATDMLARIGGEEFALLLPDADIAIAERICKRIGARLASTVTHHDGRPITVTSSMGLSSLCGDPAATLEAADKALYIAKAGGRARLQVAA